jgi:ribosome-associated heat shock protein Hsp15
MATDSPGTVRLDKWLIAARIFKTRTIAQEACDGGHVHVNDHVAVAAKAVRVGDRIVAGTPRGKKILVVLGLGERRGPADQAKLLYDDLTPPEPPSDEPLALRDRGTGRPTKRDRRLIGILRGD